MKDRGALFAVKVSHDNEGTSRGCKHERDEGEKERISNNKEIKEEKRREGTREKGSGVQKRAERKRNDPTALLGCCSTAKPAPLVVGGKI